MFIHTHRYVHTQSHIYSYTFIYLCLSKYSATSSKTVANIHHVVSICRSSVLCRCPLPVRLFRTTTAGVNGNAVKMLPVIVPAPSPCNSPPPVSFHIQFAVFFDCVFRHGSVPRTHVRPPVRSPSISLSLSLYLYLSL